MEKLRIVAAGTLIFVIFCLVAALDEPPKENRVAITAATVAAAEEYDRVLEQSGSKEAAMAASNQTYEEVLEGWEWEK